MNNKKNSKIPKKTAKPKDNKTNTPNKQQILPTDNNIEPIQDNLLEVPAIIRERKPNGQQSSYNIEIANKILLDIACEGGTSIEDICRKHGINDKTLYYWVLINDSFAETYYRVKEVRQESALGSIENGFSEVDDIIRDTEMTPQERHLYIQANHRKTQHTQWVAARISRRYRDQQEIKHSIDAGTLRSLAWSKRESMIAQDTQYTEVKEDTKHKGNDA